MPRVRRVVALVALAAAGVAGGVLYTSLSKAAAISAVHRGGNTQGAPTHAGYGATRAAIIGDSWASGYGLQDPTGSFAYELARLEGWDVRVSAVSGTGFATGAASGGELNYQSRVQFMPTDAQIVLLEGGLNDVGAIDELRPMAVRTLEAVSRRAPAATVFVVGPPLMPFHDGHDLRAVDRILADAADETGARFISTLEWQVETGDGLHPTAQAHRSFAARLSEAMDQP